MKIVEVAIEKIRTDLCVRDRYGDLSSMIRTIDDYGLLHPVGITKDYQLVYGRRRLQACRKMGWTTIPAVFVADVQTPYSIMKVENQFRLDLTPEEQVVLARKLEEEGRRNAPAFWRSIGVIKNEPGETGEGESGSNSQICLNSDKPDLNDKKIDTCHDRDKPSHESENHERTDDAAAKAVGLGGRDRYRKAETVVNQGSQPLKDAMNEKKVSIDAAYQLSKLPEDEQSAIDYDDKQAVKEKVRQIRKPPREPAMKKLKPEIASVLKLTRDWPEDQLLALIDMLKKKVEGSSEDKQ